MIKLWRVGAPDTSQMSAVAMVKFTVAPAGDDIYAPLRRRGMVKTAQLGSLVRLFVIRKEQADYAFLRCAFGLPSILSNHVVQQ